MIGPEQYQHAEMLLDEASDEPYGSERENYCLAKAQVHATLALAAATAMNHPDGGMDPDDFEAWRAVCGAPPAPEVTP